MQLQVSFRRVDREGDIEPSLSDKDAVNRTVGEDYRPKFANGDNVSAKQFSLLVAEVKGVNSAANAKPLKDLHAAAETYRLRTNFPAERNAAEKLVKDCAERYVSSVMVSEDTVR